MAIVRFSRKEFEKYCKIDEKMQEKIALFGTPLEALNNEEIEIEIFPNRPDLYSLQGYLRSFLAFLGKKTKLRQYKLNKPEKDYLVKVDKSVRKVRPFTCCSIIKNLKFNDEKIKEVIDIQEKIHSTLGRNRKKIAIGIYPLEKISLPIDYTAKKPQDIKFIPLDAAKEMSGLQILKQHPTGREYSHLLQGKDKFPVFIDSRGEILSMPPIINSEKTGKITEKTEEVFIECSGFDFPILKKTLNILVTMLADMGGKIYQMKVQYKKQEVTPDLEPEKMKISIENINKLLGLELKEKEIGKLLEKMGYNYNLKDSEVEIPAYRTDILHEVDIIEDIAIAYGYQNFVPEIPSIATIGEENKREIKKRKISEILIGLGLLELNTHHLLSKEDIKKLKERAEIEVEDSKTDYKILRPSLFPSILKVLSENVDSEYPQKLFEIGKTFEKYDKGDVDKKNLGSYYEETSIKELSKLAIALTPSNFTELKQILEYLARMLNLSFDIKETSEDKFIEGRTGKIVFDNKEIGMIGEIHPSLLREWHLKMPLVYLELDLEAIFEKLS